MPAPNGPTCTPTPCAFAVSAAAPAIASADTARRIRFKKAGEREREAPPKRDDVERIYLRTFRLPANSLPLSETIS